MTQQSPLVYALIPARGGSVSIPKKNLAKLHGRPLIAYPIATGLKSQRISRVIVSTDCKEIAAVAKEYGAEVPFLRPASAATNTATDLCVFKHFLTSLEEADIPQPDLIVHLRATAPLRDHRTINRAIDSLLDKPEATALRSVSPSSFPPFKMWLMDETDFLLAAIPTDIPNYCDYPRQAFPKTFQQDGYVDIVRPETIINQDSMGGDRILGFIHGTPNNDIDNPEDLKRVHGLVQKQFNGLRAKSELGLVQFGIIQGRLSQSESGQLQEFPKRWQEEFFLAKSIGLSFIEAIWDSLENLHNPLNHPDQGATLKQTLRDSGMPLPAVCLDLPIHQPLEAVAEEIAAKIPVFNSLGVSKLILPMMGESEVNDERFQALLSPLGLLGKTGQLYGIDICLETICPIAQLAELFEAEESKALSICLDSGNLFNEKIDPVEVIDRFPTLIRHVHIKDRNRDGDNVLLNRGEVDFEPIFEALLKHDYRGAFTFECPRGDSPEVTAKQHLSWIQQVLDRTIERHRS